MPSGISPELCALWYAGVDEWDRAHELVQNETDADNAKIHAYLHRLEGDLQNARYWYAKAEIHPSELPFQDEFYDLIVYFTGKASCILTDDFDNF